MNTEQQNVWLQLLGSAPTQGILWFIVFWGVRAALVLAKERIAWLQGRLDKYMDRDMEIVKQVATPSPIPTATRWQSMPPPPTTGGS